ncbi:MAG TPA: metalloregulator ArsR/SmtB family transcription factor [Xanthomonadales bacterium]|nr:metalloregulator ArsR/SmtB family transcription factor [Xanthomonadales bacterium]
MTSKKTVALDLELASHHCRLLSDSTRLRLLLLLEREELSVAELSAITQLAQPRVSTHLAKLKEAQLVADRREGVFVYYRIATTIRDPNLDALWKVLRSSGADPLVQQDFSRMDPVLSKRHGDSWADSVAGNMERHYSPGRTWQALAHGLADLIEPGAVLDIASGDGVLAELLAPRATHITCIDISERVIEAGRKRLQAFANVRFEPGDMHALRLPDQSFDTVFLMHALTYTRQPQVVLNEAARVLRRGGKLLALTLLEHRHEKMVALYDHANLGFKPRDLEQMATKAGLRPVSCKVSTVERRTPNFTLLTLSAARA